MVIQVVLVAVVMAAGVLIQTIRGYHHHEIWLYVRTLFGLRLAQYWSFCALGIAVHSVVNSKIAGHAGMALFVVATIALPALGFEHPLYRYGFTLQYEYSDMNGFGHYAAPVLW